MKNIKDRVAGLQEKLAFGKEYYEIGHSYG